MTTTLTSSAASQAGESKKSDPDGSDITKTEATEPKDETETDRVTSTVKNNLERVKHQEGEFMEQDKENRKKGSHDPKSGPLDLPNDNSIHVSEQGQIPDLTHCHQYDDNAQAFAEWKGSSQPSFPKWDLPPYIRGGPSRTSGPDDRNNPFDPTASTERSCGQGPNVPPYA